MAKADPLPVAPTPGAVDSFGRDFWRMPVETARALPPLTPDAVEEHQFRLLADHLPTLCWMARGDGYIVWYNSRWHQYCGSTPAEMEGWGWQQVHDPAHLPDVLDNWRKSIDSGEPFEMVFPLRGADGVFRPFLTRVSPVRDKSGEIMRWFGVNTEVGAQVRAEEERDASDAIARVLTDAMPQMVWSTRPDGHHDYYNRRWYDFTGVPAGSTDGEGWSGTFHPDDRAQAWDRWRHSLATGDPYEVEYRLRHRDGDFRWTLGRAVPVRDDAGQIKRWIGTCTDIHEAKTAAARNEVLSRELSHRIKNIFAIIAGLVRLSARRDPAVAGYARDLLQRIAALGRAHEFARPHSEASQPAAPDVTLRGLLMELFLPYAVGPDPRITISGADVPIDEKGATPIALIFHELATNAAKYGALSTPEGYVAVNSALNGDSLTLTWKEHGGPPLLGVPNHEGFGSKLAAMSSEQLNGTLVRNWLTEGLEATISLPASRLVRPERP